ncbi:hypothetical protein GL2_30910 [Microbulbifer sp. GL-2]|nr:hypothetical protein GL2_30910 [Microbulbifer sp. GL-2]
MVSMGDTFMPTTLSMHMGRMSVGLDRVAGVRVFITYFQYMLIVVTLVWVV